MTLDEQKELVELLKSLSQEQVIILLFSTMDTLFEGNLSKMKVVMEYVRESVEGVGL